MIHVNLIYTTSRVCLLIVLKPGWMRGIIIVKSKHLFQHEEYRLCITTCLSQCTATKPALPCRKCKLSTSKHCWSTSNLPACYLPTTASATPLNLPNASPGPPCSLLFSLYRVDLASPYSRNHFYLQRSVFGGLPADLKPTTTLCKLAF